MRIFVLFTFFIVFSNLNAQVKLGVQGGIGISKWVYNSYSKEYHWAEYGTEELPGLQGGIVAQIELSNKWSLRPGLILSEKGTVFNEINDFFISSQKIWLDYIGLPVSVMYKVHTGKKFNVKVGGGLYASYCFNGIQKGKGTSMSFGEYFIEAKVEFSNQNENDLFPIILRPFDWGYIINSSLQWKKFEILLSYDQGLYDLSPNSRLYNGNFRNRTCSIAVAYYILN